MNENNSKNKMRLLFWSTLGPLLLLTCMGVASLAAVSMHLIDRYVRSEASSVITRLNSQILDAISPVMVNLDDFSNFARNMDDPQTLEDLTYALGENLSYVISFYYATPDYHTPSGTGFYVGNDGWVPPDDWLPAERPWFKSALNQSGVIAYEEVYVDAMSGDLCVTVAKEVKDEGGRTKGVAAVDLLLSNLAKMAETFSVSKNNKIYLLSKNGKYMINPDTDKIARDSYFDESAVPYTVQNYLDGTPKAFVHKGFFYAVSQIGSTPWFVVVEGPVSDFSGGFVNVIIIIAIVLVAFSIAFTLLNIHVIVGMRAGEKRLGQSLLEETQGLAVSAKENAATAQDQTASVKEIVATMEDNNALSESISRKIKDVAGVAEKTSGDVADGVSHLELNVAQLREIAEANQTTIDGIKLLGDKINNIWDIVTLINSVADQAKIIAFNAELEASSAGEAGKNFHIVATEIRRLADGIIDGTKEIKEKINEIQQSSDRLIIASENGTVKIEEGCETAKSLEERFGSIKNASEVTATSAGDITKIIQQQATATEQILTTLKQIASGVESFSSATESISRASEKIRTIAEDLNG
jgi:hypothetical protein